MLTINQRRNSLRTHDRIVSAVRRVSDELWVDADKIADAVIKKLKLAD